jgi:hypothetical protein
VTPRDPYTEAELVAGRRLWAVMMLARTPEAAESLMRNRPVRAGLLDAEALRRALRGNPLPGADEFVTVTREMLDAVDEAGPMSMQGRKR